MCDKKKVNLPDLIIAAICELQEKNGVDVCEIVEFVAKKRGCKPSQIEDMIRSVLSEAQNSGIILEQKGLYRIDEKYDDFPSKENEGDDEEEKDSCESGKSEEEEKKEEEDEDDPCACLKFSKDCLSDDQPEENRCPVKKKESKKECKKESKKKKTCG